MDEVHIHIKIKTSPPTPLLTKERGDKAQLYRGQVKLYLIRPSAIALHFW
ncbi:hypothetical protein GXM_06500 [Nostoc sphaeroides CCNUC1]|uniref:Uncharacterized protein n=1 Tax=Nostoc sphaeroides CCNUC1 TaxID=2653204 RepID=A0A5P8W9Z4_9NOSO|nr:hypothetical protein GXM_06500 [Nostoc sphaeroides CCNUC1]